MLQTTYVDDELGRPESDRRQQHHSGVYESHPPSGVFLASEDRAIPPPLFTPRTTLRTLDAGPATVHSLEFPEHIVPLETVLPILEQRGLLIEADP